MRTISAAAACVILAFGAAFLVTRALDHGGSARAATQARLPALPATTAPVASDPALAAQFTPQRVALRKPPAKPKPKPRPTSHPVESVSQPAAPASPPAPTATTDAPVQTTPAYTTPTDTSPSLVTPVAPVTTTHHSTSHHSSGSGSGTTVIGG